MAVESLHVLQDAASHEYMDVEKLGLMRIGSGGISTEHLKERGRPNCCEDSGLHFTTDRVSRYRVLGRKS